MKMTHKLNLALAACGIAVMALTAGCVEREPVPPPPGVAVVGFVPGYYFWDGYEYVGWDDDYYYYWAPSHVWRICDPVRVQRVNVWIQDHPNWRTRVSPQTQSQPAPMVQTHSQPPTRTTLSSSPPATRPVAPPSSAPPMHRGHGHDNQHDHGHN